MQLTSIPKPILAANDKVLGSMQQAAVHTASVQTAVKRTGSVPTDAKATLELALGAAQDARSGVAALGAQNLLDDTFQRYANHSVRDLEAAVGMLGRSELGGDALSILSKHLFDAEVATRLASQAGERSLEHPSRQALLRATSSDGASGGSGSGSPAWVDGQRLDELGNPVRGDGGWAGPDGERFGDDGGPVGDGGYTGPDGDTYSGI